MRGEPGVAPIEERFAQWHHLAYTPSSESYFKIRMYYLAFSGLPIAIAGWVLMMFAFSVFVRCPPEVALTDFIKASCSPGPTFPETGRAYILLTKFLLPGISVIWQNW